MMPYERAQWLFLLSVYLIGQRARSLDHFADGRTLLRIMSLLRVAYWDATGFDWLDGDDADAEVAAFQHWLLTLWPRPPTA
jgi:hypothetical protein